MDNIRVRTAAELEQKYLGKLLEINKNIETNSKELIRVYNELNSFIESTVSSLSDIIEQVDKKVETWYYQGTPSLSNLPASVWTTNDEKNKHIGDLYFDISTNIAYSFQLNNGVYSWVDMEDSNITLALSNASRAQDTADGKRRIFTSQPTPPYDVGDLWTQGASGDIKVCSIAKQSGYFDSSDWNLASKYTDDSSLTNFINNTYTSALSEINSQLDKKSETWYQPTNPATSWSNDEKLKHVGDLWYDTSQNKNYIFDSFFNWQEIDGVPQSVYDKIDGKAQIFTSQPTPPYYVGDLWVQGSTGDIKHCISSRTTGSYSASDWVVSSKYTDDSSLNSFVNNVYTSAMTNVNNAINEKITTWYLSGVPTLLNNPAVNWSNDEKLLHVGDLYFDKSTGYSYRFNYENSQYSWDRVKDSEISSALATANAAQDTADGKRRIFMSKPIPPYDNGDLWVGGSSGDIKACQIAKTQGQSYDANDWILASKYTDDTKASAIVDEMGGTTTTVLSGQVVTIMNNYAKFTDLSTGGSTEIAGENITTGNIKSSNYVSGTTGTNINLTTGKISTPNVDIDNDGIKLSNGAKVIGNNGLMNTYIFESKSGNSYSEGFLGWEFMEQIKNYLYFNIAIPKGLEITDARIFLYHSPTFNYMPDEFGNLTLECLGYSRNIKCYKANNIAQRQVKTVIYGEYDINDNVTYTDTGVNWYDSQGTLKGSSFTATTPTQQNYSAEEVYTSDISSLFKNNGNTVPGNYQFKLETSDSKSSSWNDDDYIERNGWCYAQLIINGYMTY